MAPFFATLPYIIHHLPKNFNSLIPQDYVCFIVQV